jgi:hypothetical protein
MELRDCVASTWLAGSTPGKADSVATAGQLGTPPLI